MFFSPAASLKRLQRYDIFFIPTNLPTICFKKIPFLTKNTPRNPQTANTHPSQWFYIPFAPTFASGELQPFVRSHPHSAPPPKVPIAPFIGCEKHCEKRLTFSRAGPPSFSCSVTPSVFSQRTRARSVRFKKTETTSSYLCVLCVR